MLSSKDILFHVNIGNIIIEPYDEKLLNSNSYDVCLGNWYVQQRRMIDKVVEYNSDDGQNIMWEEPKYAPSHIVVCVGETILAHTNEVIGGKNIITTEMRAKSTTGRYCLSVCKCAGLGDVGFISHWTMEISNHSNFDVKIKVGEPIAQILFHELNEPIKQYAGRYGQGEWSPRDMLPKKKKI